MKLIIIWPTVVVQNKTSNPAIKKILETPEKTSIINNGDYQPSNSKVPKYGQ